MNSHSAKTEAVVKNVTVQIAANEEESRVVNANLIESAALTISDDDDTGSDPYNSTGQHVIIKAKLIPED
jgi:hypothetical protein